MDYKFGSPPVEDYSYTNFVRHLAPRLPANDRVFFWQEALDWRNDHAGIPLTLFRNICHWKSPRPFQRVCHDNNTQEAVSLAWENMIAGIGLNAPNDDGVIATLQSLATLNGVAVRTASALLTAWNPEQFGIIDRRAVHVLDMPEIYTVQSYVEFRNRLLQLREDEDHVELHDCALRQIELALWHYYPVMKTRDLSIRRRPGRIKGVRCIF